MTTPTTPRSDARAHLAAGMRCKHKWRYSNTRDTFYCQYCYLTESPDINTTPEATQ